MKPSSCTSKPMPWHDDLIGVALLGIPLPLLAWAANQLRHPARRFSKPSTGHVDIVINQYLYYNIT